jgi:hypothetical protein
VSDEDFVVEHMGGLVEVAANQVYYVDNSDRLLVGWQGTVSPPRSMDGHSLVQEPSRGKVSPKIKLSSSNWEEAQPRVANMTFEVRYGLRHLEVRPNEVYYVDHSGRVLVGFNGSVSPPCDMAGQPLVGDDEAWAPPPRSMMHRPELRLSSSLWEEAQPEISSRPFTVKHSGSYLEVPADKVYYIDRMDRVLVGWNGTVSPPRDMDGNALVFC